ncbi:19458_t:CDS:1, partial [Funneliformis geosporum]
MSFDEIIVILKELSEECKQVLFGESKWLKRFLNDNEDNGTFDY